MAGLLPLWALKVRVFITCIFGKINGKDVKRMPDTFVYF